MLSEGRLLNLGNATGHPSFVMSNSFSNQVLAQIELFTQHDNYENKVYVLPKHLDEKIARLHVEALGAHLTTLRPEQAEYVNVAGRAARTSRTTTATRPQAPAVNPIALLQKRATGLAGEPVPPMMTTGSTISMNS